MIQVRWNWLYAQVTNQYTNIKIGIKSVSIEYIPLRDAARIGLS